jgi:uncharacterized membrane protein
MSTQAAASAAPGPHRATINHLIVRLTRDELSEDAYDVIATRLLQLGNG